MTDFAKFLGKFSEFYPGSTCALTLTLGRFKDRLRSKTSVTANETMASLSRDVKFNGRDGHDTQ